MLTWVYAQCYNGTCTLQNEMDHEGDAKYIRGAVAKTEVVQNVRYIPIIIFVIRNAVRTGPFFLTGGPASFSLCASDFSQPLSLPRLPSSPPRIESSTAAAVIGPSSSK